MKKMMLSILLVLSAFTSPGLLAECDNDNIISMKPNSLYTDHGDGTVTDNETGLMWQKCSLGLSGEDCSTGSATILSWQAALEAANSNADYSYDDWRLPNKNELLSLVENACRDSAINTTIFPNTRFIYFSASPFAGNAEFARSVDFRNGVVSSTNKQWSMNVRLVRNDE